MTAWIENYLFEKDWNENVCTQNNCFKNDWFQNYWFEMTRMRMTGMQITGWRTTGLIKMGLIMTEMRMAVYTIINAMQNDWIKNYQFENDWNEFEFGSRIIV